MFRDKTIVLGVTGSIAAYKTASLASMLVKQHADVHVIMTKNAANFIHPLTFETLTKNKCLTDTFDRNFEYDVTHVSLAKKADLFMIAPASANVIGKLAGGIADDMLTTTAMAYRGPMYIAPAMNTNMYNNPILQENLKKLADHGMRIIDPAEGFLACRDIGPGKMPEPAELFSSIEAELAREKDMTGKRVLVTAGPTKEAIDPVRFISNHSTGKMGYALAKQAMLRGAQVTLISGPCAIDPPAHVRVIPIVSAQDLFEAVMAEEASADMILMAAAVADYRPASVARDKIKKTDKSASVALERTRDILAELGAKKRPGQFLCGFSMETKDLIENSTKKLQKKNLDLIVANNLKEENAGFATDTNVVTLISPDTVMPLSVMSKTDVADAIFDFILRK